MCYSLYLSTDSDQDLTLQNEEFVQFHKEVVPEEYRTLLKYPHRWFVGSKSGCSCTFRHLFDLKLGFGKPVAWYPEGEDEIAATLRLIQIIRTMVRSGIYVDCLNTRSGAGLDEIRSLNVRLDEVKDDQFRLFENYYFECIY